jgi:thioesterase domain-containing protein
MRRRHYLFLAHDRLFDRHPVRTYDVPMTLLCTEHLPEVHLDRWKSIAAAGLRLHRLGGDHASFLEEPIVADTARAIAEAIAAAIDQPERCVRGLTTTGREPGSAEASVSKS